MFEFEFIKLLLGCCVIGGICGLSGVYGAMTEKQNIVRWGVILYLIFGYFCLIYLVGLAFEVLYLFNF